MNTDRWWIVTVTTKTHNGAEKLVPVKADTLLEAAQSMASDPQWSFYDLVKIEELQ